MLSNAVRRHGNIPRPPPPPPCAQAPQKSGKQRSDGVPVLRQRRACARHTGAKECMWQKTSSYLTLTTVVTTGHHNTMCRQISACSGCPHCPSGASEALANLAPHLKQLGVLALWGRLGCRFWNGLRLRIPWEETAINIPHVLHMKETILMSRKTNNTGGGGGCQETVSTGIISEVEISPPPPKNPEAFEFTRLFEEERRDGEAIAPQKRHIWANSLKPVCFLCFCFCWCPVLPLYVTGTLKICAKVLICFKNGILTKNTTSTGFERPPPSLYLSCVLPLN